MKDMLTENERSQINMFLVNNPKVLSFVVFGRDISKEAPNYKETYELIKAKPISVVSWMDTIVGRPVKKYEGKWWIYEVTTGMKAGQGLYTIEDAVKNTRETVNRYGQPHVVSSIKRWKKAPLSNKKGFYYVYKDTIDPHGIREDYIQKLIKEAKKRGFESSIYVDDEDNHVYMPTRIYDEDLIKIRDWAIKKGLWKYKSKRLYSKPTLTRKTPKRKYVKPSFTITEPKPQIKHKKVSHTTKKVKTNKTKSVTIPKKEKAMKSKSKPKRKTLPKLPAGQKRAFGGIMEVNASGKKKRWIKKPKRFIGTNLTAEGKHKVGSIIYKKGTGYQRLVHFKTGNKWRSCDKYGCLLTKCQTAGRRSKGGLTGTKVPVKKAGKSVFDIV